MAIEIEVNGQPRSVADDSTIESLLREMEIRVPHVAVEVNLEVVPRARHSATVLHSGDRLEVVTLVGGG
jgi:sulfur carrier protein